MTERCLISGIGLSILVIDLSLWVNAENGIKRRSSVKKKLNLMFGCSGKSMPRTTIFADIERYSAHAISFTKIEFRRMNDILFRYKALTILFLFLSMAEIPRSIEPNCIALSSQAPGELFLHDECLFPSHSL